MDITSLIRPWAELMLEQGVYVYMNKGWIQKNPGPAEAFLKALVDATEIINGDRKRAAKDVSDFLKNLDPTPMEFESNSLRVEKVLTGNGEAVVNIRPQKAGQYEFFDDFHASTTKGILVVK